MLEVESDRQLGKGSWVYICVDFHLCYDVLWEFTQVNKTWSVIS